MLGISKMDEFPKKTKGSRGNHLRSKKNYWRFSVFWSLRCDSNDAEKDYNIILLIVIVKVLKTHPGTFSHARGVEEIKDSAENFYIADQ